MIFGGNGLINLLYLKRTWEITNYGKFINQFSMRRLERINKKIDKKGL